MTIPNPFSFILSKIREAQRKHRSFIHKQVGLAKKSAKGPGIAFFRQILGEISFFDFGQRKHVKKELKKFKESFETK